MNFYILKHQISNKPLHKGRTCRANLYQAVFLFIISSIPTKLKVIICISIKANPKDVTADGLNKVVIKSAKWADYPSPSVDQCDL